jgi:zinc transport system substrate-binding protein
MVRRITILFLLLLLACDGGPAGDRKSDDESARRPLVVTSNYPLYFFTSHIAGDTVRLVFPDIEGDPAFWKPGPGEIAQLQSADLVVLNGAGYVSWRDWVTLHDDRLLDTSSGFRDRLLSQQEESIHQHGPGGEHSHAAVAFTTWLDPMLAIEQAKAIEQALSRLVPEQAGSYQSRLAVLMKQLEELDRKIGSAFAPLAQQPVLFSHPVYQYLQNRYGLNGQSRHWEPDQALAAREWIALGEILRSHPAALMFWEAEPQAETRARLQELGIRSLVFRTGSNRPDSGNYLDLMNANLKRGLRKPGHVIKRGSDEPDGL